MKLINCMNCVALHYCHGKVSLPRDEGRQFLQECKFPYRGRSTDIVTVMGRQKRMSRKKALREYLNGRLVWLSSDAVMFAHKRQLQREDCWFSGDRQDA